MHPDPEHLLKLLEDAERHRRLLNELVDLGTDIARHLHFRIMQSGNAVAASMAQAFDRTTRAIRRTVLLARKLAELSERDPAHIVARKRILRTVEDAIDREADPTEAETLRATTSSPTSPATSASQSTAETQTIVHQAKIRSSSTSPDAATKPAGLLPPGKELERSVPAPSPATGQRQRGPARNAPRDAKRHPA